MESKKYKIVYWLSHFKMQLDKCTELKRLITKFELIAHQKVNISWSYFAHVVLRKCPCNQSDEAFHTSCDGVNCPLSVMGKNS